MGLQKSDTEHAHTETNNTIEPGLLLFIILPL